MLKGRSALTQPFLRITQNLTYCPSRTSPLRYKEGGRSFHTSQQVVPAESRRQPHLPAINRGYQNTVT